ncbi:flagellar filament capping protein FliD [bacterium]|nr:flagellar filament capping protein FliD [bacterium]
MGDITFTGLASGMDTSSWIEALVSIKQKSVATLQTKKTSVETSKSVLDTVKSSVSSLRTSIEKLTDAKFGGSFDLFSKNSVTSSNSSVVSATATTDAARQSMDVVVNQLATSTTAASTYNAKINEDTVFNKLASGNAEEGTFSVFVDGKKSEIEIEEDETLGSILNKLNDIDGVNARLEDGKLYINADEGKSVVVGSSSDDANFASVLGLVRDSETGNYESYTPVSAISTSDKLVDIFGDDVKGTFTIGNQEFTIDENTSLKSLIGNINSKTDAGVNAYWDASAGQLVLKSKAEGAFNINIESGTSNLTDKLGFTSSAVDEEGNYIKDENGNYVSSLVQNTQTLGDYAKLNINGTDIVSSSNTVTSDISGIDGLTLTLKSVSKENDDGVIEPTTVSVSQDTETLLSAMKSFVDAYNKAIDTIDTKTASGAALHGETSLTSLRNNIRRTATSAVNNSDLKVLANIGISTGSASNSTDTTNVNKLQIDEEKFKEALNNDPDGVKALLLGDNKGVASSGGILNKLEDITESSLEASSGYFDSKAKSYQSQIDRISTSITSAQAKVDAYKVRLQKQFNSMELAIASIQQSYSQFSI